MRKEDGRGRKRMEKVTTEGKKRKMREEKRRGGKRRE
jgi:hypothetical protein